MTYTAEQVPFHQWVILAYGITESNLLDDEWIIQRDWYEAVSAARTRDEMTEEEKLQTIKEHVWSLQQHVMDLYGHFLEDNHKIEIEYLYIYKYGVCRIQEHVEGGFMVLPPKKNPMKGRNKSYWFKNPVFISYEEASEDNPIKVLMGL